MIDPFANTKRQEPQSNQKGGGKLPWDGGDGDQAARYGENAPPIELRLIQVHRHQQLTQL